MGNAKEKNQDEWEAFDPWPFFSSLLPTSIPLGPLLHISHSLTVTYVLLSLCFRRCAGRPSLETATKFSPLKAEMLVLPKKIHSNCCRYHQNNLGTRLQLESNFQLACSINKNPHGQTRVIKGPVCVLVGLRLANSTASVTKATVFLLTDNCFCFFFCLKCSSFFESRFQLLIQEESCNFLVCLLFGILLYIKHKTT